ncbi:MAG: hypothetical protein GWP17_01135 [Aquificales bacterium]|nr:hypothetical protein [Aquificales bacterium]
MKAALENHYHELILPQLLSFLRFSAWDTDIFLDCYPALRAQIKRESDVWYEDVYQVLMQIWEQYLPLGKEDKLINAIQTLLNDMGYDETSIAV